MKKAIVCIIISFISLATNAQDIIFLKDGSEIKAKVTEVLPTEIKYKRFDNLEGPLYTMLKQDVLLVKYQNGQNEVFSQQKQATEPIVEDSLIATETNDSEELCAEAEKDCNANYKGQGNGAGTTVAVTILASPLIGLIPAAINSSSEVKDRHLNYPDAQLMKNDEYNRCYKNKAQSMKATSNWGAWAGTTIIYVILCLAIF